MWNEFVKPICIVVLGLFLLMFGVYKYTVEVAEANIIKVYVEGQKIYDGKKAFVNINSGGMTTTITIYKKLFPFNITDRVISSNDVKVD